MRIRILHTVPSCGHDSECALRVTAGQRMWPTRTEPTYFMRKGRAEPHLPQQAAARPTPRMALIVGGEGSARASHAVMRRHSQAPSVFGGQKRCIQQSPPWDIRREPAVNPPQTNANFYAFRRKSYVFRRKPGAQPASSRGFAQALVQPGLPSTRGCVRIGTYFHR